jgi:hypothetical protein
MVTVPVSAELQQDVPLSLTLPKAEAGAAHVAENISQVAYRKRRWQICEVWASNS